MILPKYRSREDIIGEQLDFDGLFVLGIGLNLANTRQTCIKVRHGGFVFAG